MTKSWKSLYIFSVVKDCCLPSYSILKIDHDILEWEAGEESLFGIFQGWARNDLNNKKGEIASLSTLSPSPCFLLLSDLSHSLLSFSISLYLSLSLSISLYLSLSLEQRAFDPGRSQRGRERRNFEINNIFIMLQHVRSEKMGIFEERNTLITQSKKRKWERER